MLARVLAAMLLALPILGASCMATEKEKPVLLCGEQLSCAQVTELSDAALAGSAEAAFKLQSFYLDQDNIEEAIYWAQVSVENGSEQGRYAYAFLLNLRGGQRDLERAKYHLKIAAKQGQPLAESLLREIEAKQQKKP